jgi:molybdate transport system substrate-binding protein
MSKHFSFARSAGGEKRHDNLIIEDRGARPGRHVGDSRGEMKVISSVGVKAALEQLKPHFERATEHKLVITYGTAVPLKRQIDAGETFDVVILTPAMLEDLTKQGKVVSDSKADVAKVGIGVAVRAGAAKPDLSTPESFKQALLDAKSVAYAKEGQSTAILVRIFERLGIAEELKAKTVLRRAPGSRPRMSSRARRISRSR